MPERLGFAPVRAHVHERDRNRDGHGAVQGHGAGDERPARRPGRPVVRPDDATTPYIKAARVKAYGATSASRVESLKELPTLAEAGLPAFRSSSARRLRAKGTPKAVIDKLVGALQSGSRIRLSCCGWPISARRSFRREGHAGGLRNQLKAEIDAGRRSSGSRSLRGIGLRSRCGMAALTATPSISRCVDDLFRTGLSTVDERVAIRHATCSPCCGC